MLTKILKCPKFGRMGKTKSKTTAKAKAKSHAAHAGKAKAKSHAAKAAKPAKKPAKGASERNSKLLKATKKITAHTKPASTEKAVKSKVPAKVAEKTKKAVKAEVQSKAAKVAPQKGKAVAPATKGKVKVDRPTVTVEVQIEEEVLLEEPAPPEPMEEVILTDAEGRRYCRVKDCDQLATVEAFCRYHYLLYWKKIQIRKKILTEGKLERYIEDLTARYPDKFLDMLRKDLKSEKEFLAAIQELEIDESQVENEFEDEQENYIDEVRGMSEPSSVAREDEDF